MSFDQNALDSLRIDRSPEPPRNSRQGGIYKWFIAAVLILAVVAAAYAVFRDNSGNWLVMVEPREFTPADFT